MITILETPSKYNFVGNDIRYILQTDQMAQPGIGIDVILNYNYIGGQVFKFPQFTVYPDKNGNVFLQLASYLYSVLKAELPPPMSAQIVSAANKQSCIFWIEFRETSDTISNNGYQSTSNDAKYALLGGIEKIKYQAGNFFASYYPQKLPFMTWHIGNPLPVPTRMKKFVFPDQEHYLTFFNYFNVSDIKIVLQWYSTDNPTVNNLKVIPESTYGNLVLHIRTSLNAFGLDAWAAANKTRIYYYLIHITDANDHVVTTGYGIYLDYNTYYKYFDFIFSNSLGGWDSTRLRGDFEKTFEISADEIQRITYNESYNAYNPISQLTTTQPVRRDAYKGDIGYANNNLDHETLIDLFMSKDIYSNVFGRWIKVINLKKSNTLGFFKENKKSTPLEWQYGTEESYYTPTYVNLGAGNVNTNVPPLQPCIQASIAPVNLPNAKEGEPYSADIKLTGTKPFAFDNINKPGWLNWTIVNEDTIHLEGIPVITGSTTSFPLTFDYTNCNPAINHFSVILNVIPDPAKKIFWGFLIYNEGNTVANYFHKELNGPPGAVITVRMTQRQVTNPTGKTIVNASEMNLNDEQQFTIGSTGKALVACTVSGDPNAHGSVVIGVLTIVSTQFGTIDPDSKDFSISKVF